MTALAYTVTDSATMLPATSNTAALPVGDADARRMPIVFLLLFVYVLAASSAPASARIQRRRTAYLTYLVPGILIMTVPRRTGTALSVAMDMTEASSTGFAPWRSPRGAVLTGHVSAA